VSSGQKRCAEDDDEWDDFQRQVGIQNVSWTSYSLEARYAREGYKKYKFTGVLLVKYVGICTELATAEVKFNASLGWLMKANSI
jgi:hypothetical protein